MYGLVGGSLTCSEIIIRALVRPLVYNLAEGAQFMALLYYTMSDTASLSADLRRSGQEYPTLSLKVNMHHLQVHSRPEMEMERLLHR